MRNKDEELGAVGGTSPGSPPGISSTFDGQTVKPRAIKGSAEASILRKDRSSHPVREKVMMEDDRRHCVSDIVGSYQRAANNPYCSQPRESTSFKYTDERVGQVLQAFEGQGESSTNASHEDLMDASCMHSNLASSVSTLVPDQNVMSAENEAQLKRISSDDPDALIDLDESTESVHEIGGLKLTELQNFSIDANRISAAIELFDPLMQESTDGRLSDPVVSSTPQTNPFNRMSYAEMSRSKGDSTLPPKISLNSLDITEEVITKPRHRSPHNSSSEQDTNDSSINSSVSDKPAHNGDVAKNPPVADVVSQPTLPRIILIHLNKL
jgi:hypothetical protein